MNNTNNTETNIKDFEKKLKKLEKYNDKIKYIEDIIFITNSLGQKELLMIPSSQYLLSKLKPLYKLRDLLYEELYPDNDNSNDLEKYLSN